MSNYRYYQEARDTAWRALLRLKEKRLPVDVFSLALSVGMETHPFPDEKENPRLAAMLARAGEGDVLSLRIRGAWHIFLRPGSLNEAEERFAVAHELGHLLLGHETRSLSPGVRAFESRENQGDLMDDPQDLDDYAADMFAIRLLAPAFLLHALHADTPEAIIRLCGLPPRAAAIRADRMDVLNERNAFLSHPLEKQLSDAFRPYLREQLGSAADASPAEDRPPARSVPLVLPEKKLSQASPGGGQTPLQRKQPSEEVPREKRRAVPKSLWLWGIAGAAIGAFILLRAVL